MMQAAGRHELYVEKPFVMSVFPQELFDEEESDSRSDTVLVQGIIDVFFVEEDGIVLLDYQDRPCAAGRGTRQALSGTVAALCTGIGAYHGSAGQRNFDLFFLSGKNDCIVRSKYLYYTLFRRK